VMRRTGNIMAQKFHRGSDVRPASAGQLQHSDLGFGRFVKLNRDRAGGALAWHEPINPAVSAKGMCERLSPPRFPGAAIPSLGNPQIARQREQATAEPWKPRTGCHRVARSPSSGTDERRSALQWKRSEGVSSYPRSRGCVSPSCTGSRPFA